MKKPLITFLILTVFFNCKIAQNEKEKFLLGIWSYVMRSDDKQEWEFTKKGIVKMYFNDEFVGSFYYSVQKERPKECENYRSKWNIDHYLYLTNLKDSSRTKCYEIIFEDSGEVSIRYLPLERDTYEIMKRSK